MDNAAISASSELTFCLDVDGVLTDGTFWYDEHGKRLKRFGPDDSDALQLLRCHISILFISSDVRGFPISKARIERDMAFPLHLVPSRERHDWLNERFDFHRLIYMGDSFLDAPILATALVGIAPENASPVARAVADYVTVARGGMRAVAEAAQFIAERFNLDIPEFDYF